MKKTILLLLIISFVPILSPGQTVLKTEWKLSKIFNIETNIQLFTDLRERSTLVFTDSTFEGRATCNTLFGNYIAGTEEIKLFDLGTTLVGCDGRRAEMENLLFKTFRKISSYNISADTLTLTDKKTIKLIYTKEE